MPFALPKTREREEKKEKEKKSALFTPFPQSFFSYLAYPIPLKVDTGFLKCLSAPRCNCYIWTQSHNLNKPKLPIPVSRFPPIFVYTTAALDHTLHSFAYLPLATVTPPPHTCPIFTTRHPSLATGTPEPNTTTLSGLIAQPETTSGE